MVDDLTEKYVLIVCAGFFNPLHICNILLEMTKYFMNKIGTQELCLPNNFKLRQSIYHSSI